MQVFLANPAWQIILANQWGADKKSHPDVLVAFLLGYFTEKIQ